MRIAPAGGVLFIVFLIGIGPNFFAVQAQKTPYTLCSRIVAVQESSGLTVNDALKALEATESDPIGCLKRKKSLGPKNGLQVSGCQDVSVLLEGQNSVFALKLEIEDKSGSLRAFQTDIQTEDGDREKAVCFQHNVPMGKSEFADDSPRCVSGISELLVMFVTSTCPEALDGCVDNWLVAVEGDCDGSTTLISSTAPVSQRPQIPTTQPPPGQSSFPQQSATSTVVPPSQGQPGVPVPLPPVAPQTPSQGGVFIPSDLPDDISLPGSGQSQAPPPPPPAARLPSGPQASSDALQISLCFRMFSTTDKVDRSTCIGFGSTIQDPIRCKEDSSSLKPKLGIAYTPCAELNARLVPGTTQPLLNLSIGGRPGIISAQLDENFQKDRPLCIFIQVEGEGIFPEEGESGCMHPWEPISIFAGKTCRASGTCSYHSLMVSGGGCQAPRLLPTADLEGLEERDSDLAVGYGEMGSKKRYGTPKGPKSKRISCKEDDDLPSREEGPGDESSSAPVITSRTTITDSSTPKPKKNRQPRGTQPPREIGG